MPIRSTRLIAFAAACALAGGSLATAAHAEPATGKKKTQGCMVSYDGTSKLVVKDEKSKKDMTFNVKQAATVLATIRRDTIEAKGGTWSAEEEAAFKEPIRAQYEKEGHPYFASARVWDDGVIDPADTRRVLALAICASLNRPIPPTRFGVFRM